jgi:cholera toxin transcriptional activator
MDASTDSGRLLRFESFELDVRSRELRKGKNRIRLQEQPFEILRMMLERPGDVVTREELAKHLWPEGTFVDFEHSLNAAVKRLRAALGDDADNPRFVETLPRRGYRFIAPLGANEHILPALPAPPDYRARLAVLPYTNSSGEAGQ